MSYIMNKIVALLLASVTVISVFVLAECSTTKKAVSADEFKS